MSHKQQPKLGYSPPMTPSSPASASVVASSLLSPPQNPRPRWLHPRTPTSSSSPSTPPSPHTPHPGYESSKAYGYGYGMSSEMDDKHEQEHPRSPSASSIGSDGSREPFLPSAQASPSLAEKEWGSEKEREKELLSGAGGGGGGAGGGEERYSQLQVAAVVGFYMVAALVMVCVNKVVLNDTPALVVTTVFIQALVTVLMVHLTSFLRPTLVTIPRLSLQTIISLTPVMLGDVAGFTLNAFCLREVDATFYQVARGLALPFTIIVSSISTRTWPAPKVILCAIIVTSGFLLGVTPPPADPITGKRQLNITPLGAAYGLAASLSVALQAVLIKRSLPYVHGSALQLAYFRNLGSAVLLFLLLSIRGEPSALLSLHNSGSWSSTTFIYGNLTTALVGFLICIAGTLSVKVTSPVTHMFSSAARSVLQVVLGVWGLGEEWSLRRGWSVGLVLGGTGGYGLVQSRSSGGAGGKRKEGERERGERDVEKQ